MRGAQADLGILERDAPRGIGIDPASLPATFSSDSAIFAEPRWAAIDPAAVNWAADRTLSSQAISGSSDLALPLSTVFIAGSPTHPLDFDADGDVDQDDVTLFESCASSPGIPLAAGCKGKDLDQDNDVDQSDLAAFQRCFSGERVPANPSCID